jgi:lysophospholipase L1-like esterase
MVAMLKPIALLLLLGVPIPAQQTDLQWIAPSDARMEIDGLPWYGENSGELFRLPLRLKDKLPKPVWNLAASPSGARIRFRTDSNRLAIRLEYTSPPNMANMHAFGQTGVDLYLDGVYRGTAVAPKDAGPGRTVEHAYFNLGDRPPIEREATLYLPLYKPVKVIAVGVGKDARLARARPFAVSKPAVFYGTSITQGGCASRSGMSYQGILGRMLNIDFVNLGFSGNGKGEAEVARAVAEIDASCFVLDFAQNNRTAESLRQVYDQFLEILREKHPQTPILAITPISSAGEALSLSELDAMREHIRETVSRRIARGDRRLELMEGTDLIGPERLDGLVDGTHPNDLGFEWMARGLEPRLAKLLGLQGPSAGRLTSAQFQELLQFVARAWNIGNARLAADCFSADALYSAPPGPRIRRGRDALFEFFGGEKGRPKPMRMEWHHIVFDEDSQIGMGEYTFTYEVRTHGIVIIRIAGGKIANWREYERDSPLEWDQLAGANRF